MNQITNVKEKKGEEEEKKDISQAMTSKKVGKYPYVFVTAQKRKEALELPPVPIASRAKAAKPDPIISYLRQNAE